MNRPEGVLAVRGFRCGRSPAPDSDSGRPGNRKPPAIVAVCDPVAGATGFRRVSCPPGHFWSRRPSRRLVLGRLHRRTRRPFWHGPSAWPAVPYSSRGTQLPDSNAPSPTRPVRSVESAGFVAGGASNARIVPAIAADGRRSETSAKSPR